MESAPATSNSGSPSPSQRATPSINGLNLDGLQSAKHQPALTVECSSSRSPRIAGLSLELGSSPRGPNVMEDSWKVPPRSPYPVRASGALTSEVMPCRQGEIIPQFLYLSDRMTAGDADRLNSIGVTHVLNVSTDIPNFYEGRDVGQSARRIVYKRCALKDRIDADIGCFFEAACAFIEDARCAALGQGSSAPRARARAEQGPSLPPARRVNGGRVLVHCRAGMSRSATIVIGYLMVSNRWDLKRSLHYVDACRFVQPNSGFMQFLIDLEKSHFNGQSSITQADLYPGVPGPTATPPHVAAPTGC